MVGQRTGHRSRVGSSHAGSSPKTGTALAIEPAAPSNQFVARAASSEAGRRGRVERSGQTLSGCVATEDHERDPGARQGSGGFFATTAEPIWGSLAPSITDDHEDLSA